MRRIGILLAIGLASCAPASQSVSVGSSYVVPQPLSTAPPETPEAKARRDFETMRSSRESELLERALSASPDYTAAVRRAAVANLEGEAALAAPAAGRRPAPRRPTEAAISAEEARLSDVVEARRRQRLAQQGQQRQNQQDQQAAAQCMALGAQIEASMYNPRSLLNLEATATANQARENCWQNYQASRPR